MNNYGNKDINDKIDEFWLSDNGGKLRISQIEQIDFLQKLYREELRFSKKSQQLVKDMMLLEVNDEYRLSAKTGMCSHDGFWYGWYVGWIETKENVYFFATHLESEDHKYPQWWTKRCYFFRAAGFGVDYKREVNNPGENSNFSEYNIRYQKLTHYLK